MRPLISCVIPLLFAAWSVESCTRKRHGQMCPAYTDCAHPFNVVAGSSKTSCRTVSGCASQTDQCHCGFFLISDTCSAFRKHTCPEIGSVKSQKATNKETGQRRVETLANQVENHGVAWSDLYNILSELYIEKYTADTANLVAFSALFSEKDPAPPGDFLGDLLFGILKNLFNLLPDVGVEIDTVLTFAKNAVGMKSGTNVSPNSVSWEQFVQATALKGQEATDQMLNGLNIWCEQFYKHHNLRLVTSTTSTGYKLMAKVIQAQYEQIPTQTEAYLALIASYLNSIGAGIVVSCTSGSRSSQQWTISQVQNPQRLGASLLGSATGTAGCLDPSTNFKDTTGRPVGMAITGTHIDSHGRPDQEGILPGALGAQPFPITTAFGAATERSTTLPCYSSSFKFSSSKKTEYVTVDDGEDINSPVLIIALSVGGVLLVVVLATVAVVARLRKTGVAANQNASTDSTLENGSSVPNYETDEAGKDVNKTVDEASTVT